MNEKKEKKFIFPENMSNEYGVFLGLSLRELLFYVLPILILAILFLIIPPHCLKLMIGKGTFCILLLTVVLAVLTSNPISSRRNIRLLQYMRVKSSYRKRQRVYYMDKRKNQTP